MSEKRLSNGDWPTAQTTVLHAAGAGNDDITTQSASFKQNLFSKCTWYQCDHLILLILVVYYILSKIQKIEQNKIKLNKIETKK